MTPASSDAGSTATDSQSLPITWGSPLAFCAHGLCLDPTRLVCGLTTLTLAPGGVAKLKLAAAGLTNEIDVKPTWNAGLAAPRANTWTRSGTFFVASMAILMRPISEPLDLGESTSW